VVGGGDWNATGRIIKKERSSQRTQNGVTPGSSNPESL